MTYAIRNHNGRLLGYHSIDDAAKAFARIARTKTLTPDALALIRALGYEIEVKHPAATF